MRQGAGAVAIRLISAALGFLLVFVLARWMKTDEFGYFGYAFSMATTLSTVLDLGQRRLIMRSMAAYRERGRVDLMRGALRFSLGVTLAAAILSAAAVALGTLAFDAHPSLYPAAVLTAAMILSEFQANMLRGLGNLYGSLLPREVLWRPMALGLMAILGGGLSIVTDAVTAMWFLAVVLLSLSLFQLLLLARPHWRKATQRLLEMQKDDPQADETVQQASAGWRASSLRLWMVTALNAGITPASVVIVGLFVAPAETGAFFAAVRVATIIAFPLQGLNLLTGPMLARSYAAGDMARLQQVASFTAASSSAAAIVGAVFLAIFGKQVLALMDPAFATSAFTQLVIMAGFVIGALCGSSGQLMNMTGHDREFLRILAVFNTLGIAGLIYLAWAFGGIGAAWGLLAVKAGWNIAVSVWARRHLGIDPSVAALIFPPKGAAR